MLPLNEPRLTELERRVLLALSDGKNSPEIAEDLGVSTDEVGAAVNSALERLGVHRRIEEIRPR